VGLALNKIYRKDCIKGLAQIDAGSVDLVFADPPFNIGYDYDVYNDNRASHEYVDWSRQWMAGVYRALKPSGTFWLAIGDEFAAELKVAAGELGFSCRSWVIWYYTFGVNCVRAFSRSHTHLLHFVKDPSDFTFNADNPAVRVKSARELVYGDRRANPKGRLPDNTWILRPQDVPESFRPHEDTWYFARVAGTFKEREGFHGCQMPEQLLGRIIRCCSNPLELVLDPFAGSGTTLAVAKKLGRRWLGFELSEDYVKRIERRLREAAVGDPLDGPADPLAGAPPTNGRSRSGYKARRLKRPTLDKETARGIVAAFRATHEGYSVDRLLADPALDEAFLAACKKRGVPGNPVIWNRGLLRVRKSGKLPGAKKRDAAFNFRQMDPYSHAAEIAMRHLAVEAGKHALDDILCDPRLARTFDEVAAHYAPGFSPPEYRWAALSIRKRAAQSKKLAAARYAEWLDRPLPERRPIETDFSDCACPGAYIVSGPDDDLYVGETLDVARRVEQMRTTPAWQALAPLHVTPIPEQAAPHGLQSALIARTHAVLNAAEHLMPELEAVG